ncbi:hypothetical protein SLS62_009125 [Diatrype stigma]|uniref:Heterokaryon incompatibility domain-containing protein n=1 Tax=Diatrype stigma TaxID=117547 RepID=A0AAN9YJB0_9PEZI
MRLLNVHTRQLEEFTGMPPSYAILSHTWTSEEVSFQDYTSIISQGQGCEKTQASLLAKRKGRAKIEGLCAQTVRDGYKYAWIDTCCIDKSSSAELSEAINSMYAWYRGAQKCYVYLEDVASGSGSAPTSTCTKGGRDSEGDDTDDKDKDKDKDKDTNDNDSDRFQPHSSFRRARWFTRGWTLQELLAPVELEFYDGRWRYLFVIDRRARRCERWAGSRERDRSSEHHIRLLAEITRIPEDVLLRGTAVATGAGTCVAARLAWAANRTTSRVEDMAYCLLGLLEVNMPLLYGEGDRAFLRLQHAIIGARDDSSLLAWGYGLLTSSDRNRTYTNRSVLARSPAAFSQCRDFRALPGHRIEDLMGGASGPFPSTMTNVGLQVVLPIISIDPANRVALGVLNHAPDEDHLVVVPLVYTGPLGKGHFYRALGSLPFLVDISCYCSSNSTGSNRASWLSLLLRRRKLKTMRILLQEYDFGEEEITFPLSQQQQQRSFSSRLSARAAGARSSFIVDFEDVIQKADYRLVSFYPPLTGSDRTHSRWRVRVDKSMGWCFLVFRRGRQAFGVTVRSHFQLKRSSSSSSSGGVMARFGEVDLATTVEHLVKKSAGEKKDKKKPKATNTVALPRFPSPSLELAVSGMP